jgi:hypothetical protein
MDMSLINQLTGQIPQRLDWMKTGDNACAYFVKDDKFVETQES